MWGIWAHPLSGDSRALTFTAPTPQLVGEWSFLISEALFAINCDKS